MLKKEYVYQEYIRREENILRAPYNPELEFYSVIKSGNVEKTKELCQNSFSSKKGLGELSHSPLQNLKYHFAITLAMLARYCIEGGLDISTSFGVSDFYIKKADMASSPTEIDELHYTACMDYAVRMKNLRKKKITSKPVAKCIDYIADHLHLKITLTALATHVGLNPSYLSRLFKNETGMTVSEYIQITKLDTAKNMLIYSDYSPAEIASILAFSDQSYFTEVFHKYTGLTPKKYQSLHLHESEIGK
ncbi:MAG: AraC family transcriptional regulator [Lachnospiraceae bacterium]|nr:AraC family transcriptional regulator [Lachnospiraceae bacterium]